MFGFFHFFVVFTTLLFVPSATAQSLPVVRSEFFTLGRSWTWDYFLVDANGLPGPLYSTETYTVVHRAKGNVLLEMSTHFSGQGLWRAHHRLLVLLDRCLAAYRNPVQKQPWSFRMFYRKQDGRWAETEATSTLAFEEKFNCNPWIHDSRLYLTDFRQGLGGRIEFMHRLWRRLDSSWFSASGESGGVMSEKYFRRGAGSQDYLVRRREGASSILWRSPRP